MRIFAIAGVGLIGGSMGLALRKAGFTGDILGISSPRTIAHAVERGAIDRGVSLEEAAATADVLYLAQPVSVILSTLDRLPSLVRSGCLVTDAGSTKSEIVRRAAAIPLFVGGHPLAGKESRGVESADPDLFRGRTYVLTPRTGEDSTPVQVESFVRWLSLCGAVTVFLRAEEHDRIVAFTSHLPQLASTALALTVGSQVQDAQQLSISGPGLRDTTRLALSSWEIWHDIVATNTAFIQHALNVYIDKLTALRDNLPTQRTGEQFTLAAGVASKLRWLGGNEREEG
jgi:prephenate dehydrogenase